MGIFRPATPGFVTTLVATVLLAIVSFSVPWFKSVFFLKASLAVQNQSGDITFGVLGYCIQANGQTSCSKPSVGYQFDPNALLGDSIAKLQIPTIVVKWVTYALVLHIVALAFAAVAAVFGLLAHVREMSMSCLSSCVSGIAAVITLIAFVFDLVFFFIVKARINAVEGGGATIGNGLWLTLAAWVLLFFSGCMYGFGRCCISKRPRGPRGPKNDPEIFPPTKPDGQYSGQAEMMRLDAVKAEADRKARQKASVHEVGLPTFQEYETRPLNGQPSPGPQYLEEEDDHLSPYRDHNNLGRVGAATAAGVAGAAVAGHSRRDPTGYSDAYAGVQRQNDPNLYPGGYAPAAHGTSAMDSYYNQPPQHPLSPPPQSPPPQHQSPVSLYPPTDPYGRSNRVDPSTQTYQDPYGQPAYGAQIADPYRDPYGHTQRQSSYHSAQTHWQDPSNYSHHPDASLAFSSPHDPSGYPPSQYATPGQNTLYSIGEQGTLAPPVPQRRPSPSNNYFPYTQPPQQPSHSPYSSLPPPINTANALPAFPAPSTSPTKERAARRQSVGGPRSPRGMPSPSSANDPSPSTSAAPSELPPGYDGYYAPGAYPQEKR